MKTRLAYMAVFALLCANTPAAHFLVRKDDTAIWATGARREGDSVVFHNRDTGEEQSVPVTEIDAIVPAVQRGRQYTPEQIQTFVDRLEDLKKTHKRHLRTLNQLQQDWKALQQPAEELDGEIDRLVHVFDEGTKDTESYKKTVFELGMMKYKDKRGTYTARIDELCARIKQDYVRVNMKRLAAMAEKEDITIPEFIDIRYLCENLGEAANPDQKTTVDHRLTATRRRAFDQNCRRAATVFAEGGQSVEAYLNAAFLLYGVKKELAVADAEKLDVEQKLKMLLQAEAKAQPTYRFDYRGYPLTRADLEQFTARQSVCSIVTFTSMTVDEQCLIIPRRNPGPVRPGTPFSVPVTLIFNRAPPKGLTLGAVVLLTGKQDSHRHAHPLEPFKLVNGHANITLDVDCGEVPSGFSVEPDSEGRRNVYIYLAYQEPECKDQDGWHAISAACRWPLR